MSTIDFFILDAGIDSVSCRAVIALRILVSKSAIGSVVTIIYTSLPARLLYAGDFALVRKFTKANSANAVLFENGMRTAADTATRIRASAVFRRSLLFVYHRFFSHNVLLNS